MAFENSINKIELGDLVREFRQEIYKIKRPADEIIYDDIDLQGLLKVCRRTTAYWREKGLITYSRIGNKVFYKLSDILLLLKQNQIDAVATKLKISL